jgi:hypothetical protein
MEPIWKSYQQRVAELFKQNPDSKVEYDVFEYGLDSKTNRQIDARVTFPFRVELPQGFVVEIPVKIIIDTKHWNKKLDVDIVGQLVSLKNDVKANLLIAVSPKGTTDAAMALGKSNGVYPITITHDLLALLDGLKVPSDTRCLVCENGYVSWNTFGSDIIGPVLYSEGKCDYCGELHIRCGECGEIFSIPQNDQATACPGECGSVVVLKIDPHHGDDEFHFYDALDCTLLKRALEDPSRCVPTSEVDEIINNTKWKYWDVAHPTIDLTEEGLMKWTGESLCLTESGKRAAELICNAQHGL